MRRVRVRGPRALQHPEELWMEGDRDGSTGSTEKRCRDSDEKYMNKENCQPKSVWKVAKADVVVCRTETDISDSILNKGATEVFKGVLPSASQQPELHHLPRIAESASQQRELQHLPRIAEKSVKIVDVSHKFALKASAHTKTKPFENDEHKLSQRQKQIDYGKNTLGYERYISCISRHERKRTDPSTPNSKQVCSKRSWDGQIRKWRRLLHAYDPPVEEGEEVLEGHCEVTTDTKVDDIMPMEADTCDNREPEAADLQIYNEWSDMEE